MNMQTKLESVDAIASATPTVGTACDRPGGNGLAYIVDVRANDSETFTLFGGPAPMSRDRFTLTIASESGIISEVSENIAAPMIYRAQHVPPITAIAAAALWERAKIAQAETRRQLAEEREAYEAERVVAASDLERYAPAWAEAAIVAEYHEDRSDSQTDYYGSTTTRTVVIGWSRHTRDLFPEMRKAAATFNETAHLADAPANAEHREKYSMGAGFYLKNGWKNSTGWAVKKTRIKWLGTGGLEFSDAAKGITAAPTVETAAPIVGASNAAGMFAIERHTHTKKGFDMFICTMAERVEREDFDRFLAAAKDLGGWYSRAWAGTPAGFAFKSEAKALQFIGATPAGPDNSTPTGERKPAAPRTTPTGGANAAEKLRTMADALQSAIDDKFRDRRANTPKQMLQAVQARQEGAKLSRAQKMMRALAACHDAGTVPAELVRVTAKTSIVELASEEIDRSGAGYYDAGIPTGKPYQWHESAKAAQAAALWALLDNAGEVEARAAEELRQKIDGLKFAKIPGYFPTPADLVARMIEAANLSEGSRILEPSAGNGAIADALRDAGHDVVCIERHSTLCDILKGKGHSVIQGDFCEVGELGAPFDAVLMNPPFERGQDLEHVARAFYHVKPGGRLVAIMGAGVMFRQDRKYSAFRAMTEERGGEFVEIPAGAFKESGTGVASVMLILRKD